MVMPLRNSLFLMVLTLVLVAACASNQSPVPLAEDAFSVPDLVPAEDMVLVEDSPLDQVELVAPVATAPVEKVPAEITVNVKKTEAEKAKASLAEPIKPVERPWLTGKSRQGRTISIYRYGRETERSVALLLIGGIHGRFEGNTVELMKAFRGVFATTPPAIPVFVLENLNPDSFAVPLGPPGTVAMRFSASSVDLNRNFPVDSWEKDITYRSGEVKRGGGGEYPLSEPESKFLIETIERLKLRYKNLVVVNYHSYVYLAGQKGTVQPAYRGEADNPVPDPISLSYATLYSRESSQSLIPRWTEYPVPGEFLNWCGEEGVTALDVELSNTNSVIRSLVDGSSHLSRNLAGVLALIRVNSR